MCVCVCACVYYELSIICITFKCIKEALSFWIRGREADLNINGTHTVQGSAAAMPLRSLLFPLGVSRGSDLSQNFSSVIPHWNTSRSEPFRSRFQQVSPPQWAQCWRCHTSGPRSGPWCRALHCGRSLWWPGLCPSLLLPGEEVIVVTQVLLLPPNHLLPPHTSLCVCKARCWF